MFKKILSASLLGLTIGLASLSQSQAQSMQPTAVIELFTSQGCSSCPPADKILGEYARENKVLALAWHVDYWNYLGWKDTFSKAEFTERQRRYATTLGRRQIYTPQAIVNGRDHVVGSNSTKLKNLISSLSNSGKGLTVPIKLTRTDDSIKVGIKSTSRGSNDATLWMVFFNRINKVKIQRGENRGKSIVYHNVVRSTQMLGMLKAGKYNVELSLAELKRQGYDACALILQQTSPQGTPGAIIGAAVIDDLTG